MDDITGTHRTPTPPLDPHTGSADSSQPKPVTPQTKAHALLADHMPIDEEIARNDMFFDISKRVSDPASVYPPNVQIYLSLIGWQGKTAPGVAVDDVVNNENMIRGLGILADVKANGQGYFFDPGTEFSQEAWQEWPHYPYLYDMTVDRAYKACAWNVQRVAPDGDKFELGPFSRQGMLLSNLNLAFPPLQLAEEQDNFYVSGYLRLVAKLYSSLHPLAKWCAMRRTSVSAPEDGELTDAELREGIKYSAEEILQYTPMH